MAAMSPQQQQQHQETLHGRDRLIARSEVISDALEVAKAYAARFAEWVLILCLIANLVEMFPFFADGFGNAVLVVQAITLDIAGFGLTTMGTHARRCGDERAARTAGRMGWTLILLMILTVGLVTLSLLVPATRPVVDITEKALILARVVVTVLYGHVVHSLRQAGMAYTNELSTLRQEVSTLRVQVGRGQPTVDMLRGHLQDKEQEVSTLRSQVDRGQQSVDTLRGHLNQKQAELVSGQNALTSLKRELEARGREVDSLCGQLQEKEREVSTLHQQVSTLQQEVSTLRVQVDRGQHTVDSGQPQSVDRGHTSGHGKGDRGEQRVIRLDANKRRQEAADQALGEQISTLLQAEPALSDRAIASKLGCSPTTVGRRRRVIERAAQEDAKGSS